MTETRRVFAFAGLRLEERVDGRVAAGFEPARQRQAERRGVVHRRAVRDLEMGLEARQCPFVSEDLRPDGERVAAGRVEGEVGAVEADLEVAGPERHAVEDPRQRVGDCGDLGGRGIDVDRDPSDDVAEVVGPGDGRNHDEEAQRSALVGTGEVDVAADVERAGAGPGAGLDGADPARGRAERRGLLLAPAVGAARQARDRRLGAVRDSPQRREEARRRADLERGRFLVTVVAARLDGERSERTRGVVGAARVHRRVERRRRRRAGYPVGPGGDRDRAGRDLVFERLVPGSEPGDDGIGPAPLGGGEDAALGAEEVEVDFLDRRLREIGEGGHDLAGLRIEVDRAFQFHVGGEAVCGDEDPVGLARERLADVDAALDRARQGRAVDRRGADLGELGAVRRDPPWRRRVRRRRRRPCRWRRWAPARSLPEGSSRRCRISDGEGVVGLCVCGTLRVTSRPDMLSAASVVGVAVRLGLKVS